MIHNTYRVRCIVFNSFTMKKHAGKEIAWHAAEKTPVSNGRSKKLELLSILTTWQCFPPQKTYHHDREAICVYLRDVYYWHRNNKDVCVVLLIGTEYGTHKDWIMWKINGTIHFSLIYIRKSILKIVCDVKIIWILKKLNIIKEKQILCETFCLLKLPHFAVLVVNKDKQRESNIWFQEINTMCAWCCLQSSQHAGAKGQNCYPRSSW